MALNKSQTKELIAELNAEVDKELGGGNVFTSYKEATQYAKLKSGVITRNPKNDNEWIVKFPIKKNILVIPELETKRENQNPPIFCKAVHKRKQPLSVVPKAPPGRETNPIKPHKQDLTPLPPKKTPIVIYGEAHLSSDRPCNICGSLIPQARIDLQPNVARCVSCQAQYEKVVDTSRKVDEGFGGSREEVRKMKAKQWGEMVNRGGSIRPKKPKRTR